LAAAVMIAASSVAGCEPAGKRPAPIESTAPPSPEAVQNLVGPGCATYGKKYATGPGSVADLAHKPVADAIEGDPMVQRFAAAISGRLNPKVDLSKELDAGEFTVFAPTDAAFRAKVPKDWARTLSQPKSADALTDLLMYHLVVGRRSPSDLHGQLETRGGQKLQVSTNGDRIRIANQANVVCGGFRTSNATIYLIDSVLMPPTTP
jgi:uncharacterized surface protein with fasciclin (FAS1) repeats